MKQIVYFFGGLATGIFIGFVVTSNKYEEQMKLEKEAMDEYYSNKKDTIEKKARSEKAEKIIKNDYFVRSSLDEGEQIIVDDELDIRHDVYPMEERVQKPYIISDDEYHNGEFHSFEKAFVTYWAGNDCLMMDDETEELNIEETIGREALDWMDAKGTDRVFVRNERMSTEYEVMYNPNRYDRFNEED